MKPTFQFDEKKFAEDIRKLSILTKKSADEVVKQQARLLVMDALKMTPPFSGKSVEGVTKQSFAEKRQAGKDAIARDVRRIFVVTDQLPIVAKAPWAKKALEKWGATRNSAAINKILRHMNQFTKVAFDGDDLVALHKAAMDPATGRIKRKSYRVLLLGNSAKNAKAIERCITAVQKSVGKAMSGWLKAADALKLKGVPKWIKGAEGTGIFEERGDANKTEITVGNGVEYIQRAGRELAIMRVALRIRAMKLGADIERKLAHAFKGRG